MLFLTICVAIDGALVEGHDVLGEGSCLVTEDVLHLSQFFIQCGGPGLCCCVTMAAEHPPVPINEITVTQTNHLHTRTDSGRWKEKQTEGYRNANVTCFSEEALKLTADLRPHGKLTTKHTQKYRQFFCSKDRGYLV